MLIRWQEVGLISREIVMWGASDQCRVNFPILSALGYQLKALIDDTSGIAPPLSGVPVLLGRQGLEKFLNANKINKLGFVIAIGNPFGHVRMELHRYMKDMGLIPVSFADPSAFICNSVRFGAGLQVMPSAILHNNVIVGEQCIINTRALVEHDCSLADGVEIGPGAVLCGRVTVGQHTWIGANATVRPRITIGSNSIIGAGSVVVSDIPSNVIMAGVPAKIIKENSYV